MRLSSRPARFLAATLIAGALAVPTSVLAQGANGMSTVGAYLAAQAATLRSDLVSAARFYRIVFDRNPADSELAFRILLLWIETGDIDRAVPIAGVVIGAEPGFEAARLVLAAEAIGDGNFGLAQMQLEAVVGDSLSAITTGVLSAWVDAGKGDVDAALERLARLEQSDLFQKYHAALIADAFGQSDRALALISEVYQPGSSQRLTETFARILARNGYRSDAEEVVQDFLAGVPNHPALTLLLEDIRAGAEIEPTVDNARQGAAELFYGLASSLIGNEDFQTSILYLQFARYLGTKGDLPTVLLGQVLQAQQRHREAVAVLDTVEEDSPFFSVAAIGASVSDSIRGFRERAAERLEVVVAADPFNVDAANTLAGIYRNLQRWEDVVAVLSATIDAAEIFLADDWLLFFQRGVALERLDRWDEAEVEFRRALALSPDQPDVLNYLGYTWVDRGENYIEALDMIRRAAEQAPDSGAIIDSLGWAYFKLGDFDDAVAALEHAVLLAPSHPVILDHLGDAYWRVGRFLEAGYKWSQALEEETDEEAIERLRDKIENGLPELQEGVPEGGLLEIR